MEQMKRNKSWLHFIGMCGVTMAPLANVFKNMGWFITGSDRGIFPPMSDYLKRKKIPIELGFRSDHLLKSYYKKKRRRVAFIKNQPDLVVVGNYIGLSNVEYKYAKEKDLKIMSYPEVLEEYLVKSNSVVIAGTYGKTTSSALLSLIFSKAGNNPSFMIGGIAKNFKDGIVNTKSDWSVIEGDEYISARFDKVSKFFHYKPEFLMLTACAWEHTDIFKDEQEYVDNFKKLVTSIPKHGIIVANRNGENVKEVLKEARCKVITYELNKVDNKLAYADWFNLSHKENIDQGEIMIFNRNTKEEFSVNTLLIGEHNRENIIGCCALSRELDIKVKAIKEAVEKFVGIKRRLELRFEEENVKILDDHACSPPKVLGSLSALRDTFPEWYITIIFEPNVGNRTKEAMQLFKGVFKDADEVIIPRLKTVKTKEGDYRTTGKQLADILEEDNINVKYIGDDDKLVKYVRNKDVGKQIICFMGAYSFRGMIPLMVKAYNGK